MKMDFTLLFRMLRLGFLSSLVWVMCRPTRWNEKAWQAGWILGHGHRNTEFKTKGMTENNKPWCDLTRNWNWKRRKPWCLKDQYALMSPTDQYCWCTAGLILFWSTRGHLKQMPTWYLPQIKRERSLTPPWGANHRIDHPLFSLLMQLQPLKLLFARPLSSHETGTVNEYE